MQVKPEIVDILQREGIELRQKGGILWARCPLHHDKTPSFKVDPARQTFHCFGCNSHGDVIAFIQQYRKVSFKEALAILRINRCGEFKPDPLERKRRTLITEFKAGCVDYSNQLAWELRCLRRLVQHIETEEDLALRVWAYHEIPAIEYKLDVLCYGSDEAKYFLYKEAVGNESIV